MKLENIYVSVSRNSRFKIILEELILFKKLIKYKDIKLNSQILEINSRSFSDFEIIFPVKYNTFFISRLTEFCELIFRNIFNLLMSQHFQF